MSDPNLYEYPSPLAGWEHHAALSDARNPDQKSLRNPTPTTPSHAYTAFPSPIPTSAAAGFDIHIYFQHWSAAQTAFAKALHQRIRLEFPELRVYKLWEQPVGPHPVGMFEVNVFTPAQFGALVSWLVVERGPLSVLVHPNTGRHVRDHTQLATWMGQPWPLDTSSLRWLDEQGEASNQTWKAQNGDK